MGIGIENFQYKKTADNNTKLINGEKIGISVTNVTEEKGLEVEDIDATIVKTDEEFETSGDLEDLGKISYDDALLVNGKEFNLYPTFDNLNKVIKSLTEECPTVIKEMKEQYKFKSLNKSSVEDYIIRFGEYQELIYQSGRTNTLEDEINAMLCFIDIYENEEQNENIIEKAETIELENIEEKVQEEITMDNLDDCTEDCNVIRHMLQK